MIEETYGLFFTDEVEDYHTRDKFKRTQGSLK